MRSKADKSNLIAVRVKPYQKKISFNMAFHVTRIVAGEWMRSILFRDRALVFKQFQNIEQFFYLLGISPEPFIILFILG